MIQVDIDRIKYAESLGYDSIWTAEAYGADAVTPAAWILAQTDKIKVGTSIMQMPARSPACSAMTAMTLNQLSNGRFIVGLGASGPQVVEGWHGVAYGRPITRTKEYISIMKKVFAREAPVEHDGFHYSLPYSGDDGTGLGKPLKEHLAGRQRYSNLHGLITPNGLAGKLRWLMAYFYLDGSSQARGLLPHIEKGLAKSERTMMDYDIAPFITCIMGDDINACRQPIKGNMALYIGGMGARDKNFYNDYCKA